MITIAHPEQSSGELKIELMHNISYYFTCVPSKDSQLTVHPKVCTSQFTVYLKGNKGPKNCGNVFT